jgi:hypothetical protein
MHLPAIDPKKRNILILTSIATKIFVAFLLVIVFRSFIDMYDYQLYYQSVQNIVSGALPWANGVAVYYPPLAFFPMLISYAVSSFAGTFGFVVTMWILLAICDIVTIFCIYYIGLKLYSEQTAFIAAMLYATAISVAYYSLSKFDAFPTCLAMLAILATIYGDKTQGYLASVAGLFVKLWPILLFPFLWIYNSRRTSLVTEGKKRALWIALSVIVLFGVMIAAGFNGFFMYTSVVYCNTIVYALSQYLQMAGIALPFSVIVTIFRILTAAIILGALYYQYKQPKTISLLLKVILISIMATIFLMQYRSPQYSVWFIPFAALLLATDIRGILLFTGIQILSFIEFPLAFYSLYTNVQYTSPLALGFFTLFFLAYGLLLWQALKMEDQHPVTDPPKKIKTKL